MDGCKVDKQRVDLFERESELDSTWSLFGTRSSSSFSVRLPGRYRVLWHDQMCVIYRYHVPIFGGVRGGRTPISWTSVGRYGYHQPD